MNATELMRRILQYGADERGIADRFGGNAELYASCLQEFMDGPYFERLRSAVEAEDYGAAFEAAHALKGLSGNLGVTGFYNAICTLTESLRGKRYAEAQAEYAEVGRQIRRLKTLLADEPFLPTEPAVEPEDAPPPKPARKRDRFVAYAVVALVLFIALVGALLTSILGNYRQKMTKESAEHLVEITKQVALYTEEKIANDWRTAGSIGDSILHSNLVDDDEAILSLMRGQRERWQATDIQLLTGDGYAICADGQVDTNDAASDMAARARQLGKYMSIIDSRITYTIPVDTGLTYRGAQIVAISVIQSMETFLDEMDFVAFGGDAWMYLTEQSGMVLSRLTNELSVSTFNFSALMRERAITVLSDGVTEEELLAAPEPAVFVMSRGQERDYGVSAPVHTDDAPLRLVFLAPVDVVNKTMNSFSRQLSVLSMLVVLAVVAFAFAAFISIYRNRKRQFDKALLAREHMFDLLSKHTQTAFGLFTLNRQEPDYVSSNFERVAGEPYYTLRRTENGYQVRGGDGADSLPQLSERMLDWDGASEFRSGYLQRGSTTPPSYFSLQLYPTDSEDESFVCIVQDVTQTYERENATREALAMAERSNEAKSRFFSNMSHDIRTPMNAIVNMTNFALESVNEPKKLGLYLQTIRESSDHLLRLINDVLDMSRIESGQTTVESAPFDLLRVLERQADIIRPLSDAKRLMLLTDFSGVHTAAVLGDQLKLSQILMNLLSNAVKFTPEHGAVRFVATEVPSLREDIVDIRCTVEDNGIGISPENLQHIFEPFNRANDSQVSKIEGTGLGLSICHSYVAAMGGTLHCESEEGEGSTFVVELFFEKAYAVPTESAAVGTQGAMPFLGKHCLLAEDNETNQLIAHTMLERLGFLVDLVDDGGACVDKFRASRPGTYDIIYLDIHMPVLDGYQAAEAIRACDHPQAQRIPIVAMTANVFAEDIERARIAGMDGHLSKPLLSAKLVEETNLAIQKRKDGPQ